jgi:hypothetical protein
VAKPKIDITLTALTRRVNRKLAKDGELLRYLGPRHGYCIVNSARNYLVSENVNVEALARDLKVLKPWEVLACD